MRVLPRLFKLWPWIDLDLFYIKVKFGYIGVCMGESEFFFFGNYCSLRSQSRLKHSAKQINEVEWVSKVNVILWTWPKFIQISRLNVWLWPVYSGERFRASWPSCLLLHSVTLGSLFTPFLWATFFGTQAMWNGIYIEHHCQSSSSVAEYFKFIDKRRLYLPLFTSFLALKNPSPHMWHWNKMLFAHFGACFHVYQLWWCMLIHGVVN